MPHRSVITSNSHGGCLTAIHEGLGVSWQAMGDITDIQPRTWARWANGEHSGPYWTTTARLIAASGRLPEIPSEVGRLLLEAQAFGSEWCIVPAEARPDRLELDINRDGRVNVLDRIAELASMAQVVVTEMHELARACRQRRHEHSVYLAKRLEACAVRLREIVRIERENTNEPGGGSRPLHGSRRP
jgi:hypothetical protein